MINYKKLAMELNKTSLEGAEKLVKRFKYKKVTVSIYEDFFYKNLIKEVSITGTDEKLLTEKAEKLKALLMKENKEAKEAIFSIETIETEELIYLKAVIGNFESDKIVGELEWVSGLCVDMILEDVEEYIKGSKSPYEDKEKLGFTIIEASPLEAESSILYLENNDININPLNKKVFNKK